jgi:hypothetical protein
MNEGATGRPTDKKNQPSPDWSLPSNLQTWLVTAKEASPSTITHNLKLANHPSYPGRCLHEGEHRRDAATSHLLWLGPFMADLGVLLFSIF